MPVKYKVIDSMAILDSGAGISIATKPMWERWEQMNLQLVDNSLNNPIRIVEDITMESCGIEYEHTFAIVFFLSEHQL